MRTHLLLYVMIIGLISACVAQRDVGGYVVEQSRFSELQPGMSKEETQKLLGSPSSISNFGKETWYYIGTQLEHNAFERPEVTQQRVIWVTFDEQGKVDGLDAKDGVNGRAIDFAKDATPTEGNRITIWGQLLGNLGRFNPKE